MRAIDRWLLRHRGESDLVIRSGVRQYRPGNGARQAEVEWLKVFMDACHEQPVQRLLPQRRASALSLVRWSRARRVELGWRLP